MSLVNQDIVVYVLTGERDNQVSEIPMIGLFS